LKEVVFESNFVSWRQKARELLISKIEPQTILWRTGADLQDELFSNAAFVPTDHAAKSLTISKEFLTIAETVSYHRDDSRWGVLYRTAFRLCYENSHLLQLSVDPDIHLLQRWQKSVSRDAHKMKAFVRFRKVGTESPVYVAWYRPDHPIVPLVAPFFARRFNDMAWSIITPDGSAFWDREQMRLGPGVPSADAPSPDTLEDLWRTYYVSIFNPARVKVKAMKKELPVRFWENLPESREISRLLKEHEIREKTMIDHAPISSSDFLPAKENYGWDELKSAANHCQGCSLFRPATQTVFGQGPVPAELVIIGEQPGDQEDLAGTPFVGPAGDILNRAFELVGISRGDIYLTNVVKHFKFAASGKRRLHQKPRNDEIVACQAWLLAEMKLVRPKVVVCLGASAAFSVIGRLVRINEERGKFIHSPFSNHTLITFHPSAVLRNHESSTEIMAALVEDLRRAKTTVDSRSRL
jgi:probable DNA metabolism protein